ncbi:enoyl-CoA hydratase/isomerase family protein [Chelatococcus reniformis]|uniref:3-hydroxybutyryl-CoA dehydratase n=1 Tax=Chelatococcus reniformis TaxID=1494448 RepID=A0A916UF67_9HYPH|nr:enoyl-CoA hydratase/isomerase family protein [Chelatococcus reniformis]GGC70248.1 3-hydroxybutyryl-CoA dehydratase [Chelatococcus reniformis]
MDLSQRSAAETDGAAASPPLLTIDGACATIRLNRPAHLNRIQREDIGVITTHLERIEHDRTIRALVLTGTGRAFSAGYDLGDLARQAASPAAEIPATADAPSFEAMVDCLENVRVPTIARLNGSVYGGSTDLALACDFRIGVAGMEMFMPAARLGLHYYRGGVVRYVSRLGPAAARKLFLTAARIDADEMLRIGYLDELVTAEQFDERVNALAATLAGLAPLAVQGLKRTINEIARNELDGPAADARHRASLRSDDIKEGAAAFAEKRRPHFKGR